MSSIIFYSPKRMYTVGISVLTYNIDPGFLYRFIDSVDNDSKPKLSYLIHASDDNCTCEVNGETHFNRNKGHNNAIKKIADLCNVIICADVDLLVPPGYIDYSNFVCVFDENYDGFSGIIRNIPKGEPLKPRKWKEWNQLKNHRNMAFGPWTALKTDDWFKIGGWNEHLYSWGYDRHIFDRCVHNGLRMKRTCPGPLIHPPHNRRNKSIKGIDPERVNLAQQTIGEKFI